MLKNVVFKYFLDEENYEDKEEIKKSWDERIKLKLLLNVCLCINYEFTLVDDFYDYNFYCSNDYYKQFSSANWIEIAKMTKCNKEKANEIRNIFESCDYHVKLKSALSSSSEDKQQELAKILGFDASFLLSAMTIFDLISFYSNPKELLEYSLTECILKKIRPKHLVDFIEWHSFSFKQYNRLPCIDFIIKKFSFEDLECLFKVKDFSFSYFLDDNIDDNIIKTIIEAGSTEEEKEKRIKLILKNLSNKKFSARQLKAVDSTVLKEFSFENLKSLLENDGINFVKFSDNIINYMINAVEEKNRKNLESIIINSIYKFRSEQISKAEKIKEKITFDDLSKAAMNYKNSSKENSRVEEDIEVEYSYYKYYEEYDCELNAIIRARKKVEAHTKFTISRYLNFCPNELLEKLRDKAAQDGKLKEFAKFIVKNLYMFTKEQVKCVINSELAREFDNSDWKRIMAAGKFEINSDVMNIMFEKIGIEKFVEFTTRTCYKDTGLKDSVPKKDTDSLIMSEENDGEKNDNFLAAFLRSNIKSYKEKLKYIFKTKLEKFSLNDLILIKSRELLQFFSSDLKDVFIDKCQKETESKNKVKLLGILNSYLDSLKKHNKTQYNKLKEDIEKTLKAELEKISLDIDIFNFIEMNSLLYYLPDNFTTILLDKYYNDNGNKEKLLSCFRDHLMKNKFNSGQKGKLDKRVIESIDLYEHDPKNCLYSDGELKLRKGLFKSLPDYLISVLIKSPKFGEKNKNVLQFCINNNENEEYFRKEQIKEAIESGVLEKEFNDMRISMGYKIKYTVEKANSKNNN